MDLEIKKNLKKNYYNNSDNDKTNAFEALKFVRLQKLSLVNVPFGLF